MLKCPHCGKDVDLVAPKELRDRYGLTANIVQHAKDKDEFPEPYLALDNRHLYLRDDVERYVAQRQQSKIEAAVASLMEAIDKLPSGEQSQAKQLLGERLTK